MSSEYTPEQGHWESHPLELKLSDGDLTLDSSRYPYAQASLTLTLPEPAFFERIKPGQRVNLNATAQGTWVDGVWVPEPGLTADLNLVSREASEDGKEITLELSSDEVLLEAWAPLQDDSTPRTHEANLRNLVNYVLGKVSPGAALQAGTANADITAQWDATNLLKNPDADTNVSGWASGSGVTAIAHNTGTGMDGAAGFLRATQTGTTGAVFLCDTTATGGYDISAREGQMFTVSAYAKHSTTGATASISLRFLDSSDRAIKSVTSVVQAMPTTWGTRWSVTAVAPANTAKVAPYMSIFGTASGRTWDIDRAMLTEGPVVLPFFDGNTPDTANYTYAWDDAANGSTSTRTATPERPPELFTWRAGQNAWDFLEPLTASAGLRLFCDEQRRWHLINPAQYAVPGRFSARPDNTVEGSDTMDQRDEETGITGVVVRFEWTDAAGVDRTRDDFAGVAGKVKLLEYNSPYLPGVAAAHLKKVQGQNRTQDVTCAIDLSTRPGQEVQIDLPSTEPQLGTLTKVNFELTTGLMSLQSAGLKETPVGAIDLLDGSIDALAGTIDSL